MDTRLITLADGTRVEVEIDPRDRRIADTGLSRVDKVLDDAKSILIKASEPIISALHEINKAMTVDQAEVEVGFAFEAEGNLFITRSKLNASLTIKLILKPTEPGTKGG